MVHNKLRNKLIQPTIEKLIYVKTNYGSVVPDYRIQQYAETEDDFQAETIMESDGSDEE